MPGGEALTRSLAAIAVVCYLLRVLIDVWGSRSQRIARWNRRVWTLGCLALWLHVAAAFHFIHDWSHAAAVRQTAEQTKQLTGFAFGGGVYFNYVFAAVWLLDVVLCWRRGWNDPANAPARFWTIHAVFAFMMVNATVVFGPAYWRSVGIAFAGLFAAVWACRRSGTNN
jgi:hypothetical protein